MTAWRPVRQRVGGSPSFAARAVRAVGVIAGSFFLLAAGSAVSGCLPGPVGSEVAGAVRESEETLSSQDSTTEGALPVGLVDELFGVEGFEDVRVSEGGDVVGFLSHDAADETFAALKGRLEENGWTFVESGIENAASFAKPGGAYQACFLSCTEVAGMTAVVVQCPRVGADSGAAA